jgi:hypothetical protein
MPRLALAAFLLATCVTPAFADRSDDATMFRSCRDAAEERGKDDDAELFAGALEELGAGQAGPTKSIPTYSLCLGLTAAAVDVQPAGWIWQRNKR